MATSHIHTFSSHQKHETLQTILKNKLLQAKNRETIPSIIAEIRVSDEVVRCFTFLPCLYSLSFSGIVGILELNSSFLASPSGSCRMFGEHGVRMVQPTWLPTLSCSRCKTSTVCARNTCNTRGIAPLSEPSVGLCELGLSPAGRNRLMIANTSYESEATVTRA